jgi:hypothetical protein
MRCRGRVQKIIGAVLAGVSWAASPVGGSTETSSGHDSADSVVIVRGTRGSLSDSRMAQTSKAEVNVSAPKLDLVAEPVDVTPTDWLADEREEASTGLARSLDPYRLSDALLGGDIDPTEDGA